MPVLLLNKSYEPLCTITVKRSMKLLYDDKVDIVENTGMVWHSANLEIEVPSVLALRKFVKIPGDRERKITLCNKTVLARDGHRCGYCGERATTVDHVIARSKGGEHEWWNVVAACERCNFSKRDMSLEKYYKLYGKKLLITPKEPSGARATMIALNNRDIPSWQKYLVA